MQLLYDKNEHCTGSHPVGRKHRFDSLIQKASLLNSRHRPRIDLRVIFRWTARSYQRIWRAQLMKWLGIRRNPRQQTSFMKMDKEQEVNYPSPEWCSCLRVLSLERSWK